MVKDLYTLLANENTTEMEFKDEAYDRMNELRDLVLQASNDHGYDSNKNHNQYIEEVTWTLPSAIMYAVTLITVVGKSEFFVCTHYQGDMAPALSHKWCILGIPWN